MRFGEFFRISLYWRLYCVYNSDSDCSGLYSLVLLIFQHLPAPPWASYWRGYQGMMGSFFFVWARWRAGWVPNGRARKSLTRVRNREYEWLTGIKWTSFFTRPQSKNTYMWPNPSLATRAPWQPVDKRFLDLTFAQYTLCRVELMAPDTQPKVCLDVAVDHRIRRLFKPVSIDMPGRSNHVSCIESRGWSLKRPRSEIQVTTHLAGPAVKGGIAVALQQPRHNHPFEKGLNAVIQGCETLCALDDVFAIVSCGTLNIRTNIAVVDLLPYVSEDIAKIDDATLKESFRASTQIICDMEPNVLLCAGKIQLGDFSDRKGDARKGDFRKFESIGVGKKFGSTPKLPVAARIRRGERGFVAIRRVNGFHPSHAMNHNPHVSLLRPLQILIGAETCGMLREDWEEEEWMGELRRRCQDISRTLSGKGKPSISRYPLSSSQTLILTLFSIRVVVSTCSTAEPKAKLKRAQ